MLSEVHVIIYTCVFTCVTSVPCAPVLVGNPGSGRNAPVTLWHADIKIYITTNTANCVNNALMRELVLMILEEDIALCMQNFCIKCYRHGTLHISYIYFTLYLIYIIYILYWQHRVRSGWFPMPRSLITFLSLFLIKFTQFPTQYLLLTGSSTALSLRALYINERLMESMHHCLSSKK